MRARFSPAILAAIVPVIACSSARATFFLGSPTSSFISSSGTVTSTPALVPNNPNQEIDVNGQFDVTNATPTTQTANFYIKCLLDPTFNGGSPLLTQLQISQNGFVVVPVGGNIYGWTITADIIDNTGVSVAGALTTASSPAPLYTAGTTTYGPVVTPGSTFLYNPAVASELDMIFTSNFDGLGGPNVYTWDFPLSAQLVGVPEPASLSLLAGGALMMLMRRRRASL